MHRPPGSSQRFSFCGGLSLRTRLVSGILLGSACFVASGATVASAVGRLSRASPNSSRKTSALPAFIVRPRVIIPDTPQSGRAMRLCTIRDRAAVPRRAFVSLSLHRWPLHLRWRLPMRLKPALPRQEAREAQQAPAEALGVQRTVAAARHPVHPAVPCSSPLLLFSVSGKCWLPSCPSCSFRRVRVDRKYPGIWKGRVSFFHFNTTVRVMVTRSIINNPSISVQY